MNGTITKEVLAGFQDHLREQEKSEATIQKYLRGAAAFAAFSGEAGATRETVLAFKRRLVAQNYAARSVNSMLASLNSLLSYLGLGELRAKTLRLQRQVYCPEKKELTRAEYERLCLTARRRRNDRLELVLQTICGTGIRVSELRFITVEAARRGEAVVRCKGKTRSVFLIKALRKRLLRYAAQRGVSTGAIFVSRTGRPMDRTSVWRQMKSLCHDARVEPGKVFPHNLRHLFARVFYNMDKDLAKLADILGHSSIETTRIYIVSTGSEHRKRMENMRLIV